MSKKKTPVRVTIKRGKHKTQPWTVTIDGPGPGPHTALKTRYANERNAYIGALRKLQACTNPNGYTAKYMKYARKFAWQTLTGRPIEFTLTGKGK